MKPFIRPASPVDYPAVAKLLNLCFADEPSASGPYTRMSLSDMAAEGSALFVLVHSDAIAGFVQVDHTREGIFKLSVHESLRGNDYGELLMQAAEAHAKSLGWEEVWLGILKPWLVDYYGKQDYVLTTRREKMEGMPDVEFLMLCKQLIG